jgi:hypothetical protein
MTTLKPTSPTHWSRCETKRVRPAGRRAASYQASLCRSRTKLPVRLEGASEASQTMVSAPCSTERVALGPQLQKFAVARQLRQCRLTSLEIARSQQHMKIPGGQLPRHFEPYAFVRTCNERDLLVSHNQPYRSFAVRQRRSSPRGIAPAVHGIRLAPFTPFDRIRSATAVETLENITYGQQ